MELLTIDFVFIEVSELLVGVLIVYLSFVNNRLKPSKVVSDLSDFLHDNNITPKAIQLSSLILVRSTSLEVTIPPNFIAEAKSYLLADLSNFSELGKTSVELSSTRQT